MTIFDDEMITSCQSMLRKTTIMADKKEKIAAARKKVCFTQLFVNFCKFLVEFKVQELDSSQVVKVVRNL